MAARTRRIESGEQKVIGVNDFTETAESPLGGDNNIMKVDHAVEQQAIDELASWLGQAVTRQRLMLLLMICAALRSRKQQRDASVDRTGKGRGNDAVNGAR